VAIRNPQQKIETILLATKRAISTDKKNNLQFQQTRKTIGYRQKTLKNRNKKKYTT
jgi:hypothetical protein